MHIAGPVIDAAALDQRFLQFREVRSYPKWPEQVRGIAPANLK
jgi:hypothetical protein